ncbi:lipocalin family protein [Spirosoma sp. KNUC1025]|uniref:lipocalin family protein n=1 Tax=Spirosoma sp. KNUC1025 TaxID=2894082 RepID=UPI003868908A|nr:lipocalin family protein [Spirosoma sp. KNUC1025]
MKMNNLGRQMAWAMVVAMPLWFGSCKKENAGGGDPVTPNAVEGSWKISAMAVTEGNESVDYLELLKNLAGEAVVTCMTDTKITFNSNSSVTGVPSPACNSADMGEYNPVQDKSTWKTNGNKISITSSEGSETYDYTVSGNTMKWNIQTQDDSDGDGVKETQTTTIQFKRV